VVFSYITYNFHYIQYSETKVRIFNSLNSALQDVLVLTATVDLITRRLPGSKQSGTGFEHESSSATPYSFKTRCNINPE